jgi:RNA polymerase sigma factor (sigma-70 family)
MDTQRDDERLYAACGADGSPEQAAAFQQIWPALYRAAYAMLARHPDAEAIAADCAQTALIKIHRNLASCHSPERFRAWCAQIVRRAVLDELRRPEQARRATLPADDAPILATPPPELPADASLRDTLQRALDAGPLSERSRRVVVGRYFAEQSDEALARAESRPGEPPVLPSHIQVTRAKNLAKLRSDVALVARLRELIGEGGS